MPTTSGITRRNALLGAAAAPFLGAGTRADQKPAKRIKVGQIGVGHAHATKLAVYRASPDYEVVGVVDHRRSLRGRSRDAHGERDQVRKLVLIGVVEGVSPSLEEAAQTLRADGWRTFTTVSLPLMRPGLANAFLVGFIESIADFGRVLSEYVDVIVCRSKAHLTIERLAEAEIPVEIVPGVTSASAMAAALGISLTHRNNLMNERFGPFTKGFYTFKLNLSNRCAGPGLKARNKGWQQFLCPSGGKYKIRAFWWLLNYFKQFIGCFSIHIGRMPYQYNFCKPFKTG